MVLLVITFVIPTKLLTSIGSNHCHIGNGKNILCDQ